MRHGLSGECSYKNADQVQGKKEYGATKAALPWQRHYLGSPFGGGGGGVIPCSQKKLA